MRDKLTWLHISDIHFFRSTEWRDSKSRSTLLDFLASVFLQNSSLRPDFIFCTGDIAYGDMPTSSLSDQLGSSKSFFSDLLHICGQDTQPLPRERLFVVPGNHDVDRNNINIDAQSALAILAQQSDDHVETINQRVNDRSKEFCDSMRRLDQYSEFLKDFLPHQYDSDGRQHYARVVEIDGLSVGIAGFNSSWTCGGAEDDRNLWLAAKWQFNAAAEALKDANIRIGLMHHPIDWLNSADRTVATHRIASDFDFWLHGHSHTAWVTPVQSHIVIAAGAIGAVASNEFGINIASFDFSTEQGVVHLYKRSEESNLWGIAPVSPHAPDAKWSFFAPTNLRRVSKSIQPQAIRPIEFRSTPQYKDTNMDFVERYLSKRLDEALLSFSGQPKVWVTPIVSTKAETETNEKEFPSVDLADLCANPRSAIIKAPPQYGLTCLSLYLTRDAWRNHNSALWLYLDCRTLRPHAASIDQAISDELRLLGGVEEQVKCVILDSWSANDKDSFKLLNKLCERFQSVPLICMHQLDSGLFPQPSDIKLQREFDSLHLWSLTRANIRNIVSAYNDAKVVGDEDAVTSRLVSDMEVLNLHRTPLNCLTLLKVSEFDFDESPVNRSEIIKRVLFLLFSLDPLPTYKIRPDLKDCEYVLGFFCEILIREISFTFTRDRFLLELQRCCQERLIDLEVQVVFDVLFSNCIIVKQGDFYRFKFSYWIFYFAAQRMHHDNDFAVFIFEKMRYANYPELIEFYTGIDRRREDALEFLIRDIHESRKAVRTKCGLPEEFNPYKFSTWKPVPKLQEKMEAEIANGVLESNLPAEIKDQFADRHYDPAKPYDQRIATFLTEHSFSCMMQTMRAGSRALRNSDYASPEIKRQLLAEILACWEEAARVLFVILPLLAEKGHATFDGTGFSLASDFGDTPQARFISVLAAIPSNIITWCRDDLFSQKMGPLLLDQLQNKELHDIERHVLILLLIQQRPRGWIKPIQRYIATISPNSFYLMDIYEALRIQYQYGFVAPQTLRDIEHLIKTAAAKHLTGAKDPGIKVIKKIRFSDDVLPRRNVE